MSSRASCIARALSGRSSGVFASAFMISASSLGLSSRRERARRAGASRTCMSAVSKRRVARERHAPGDQLVEQHAARVEVAPARRPAGAPALLGRHVLGRADDGPARVSADLLLAGASSSPSTVSGRPRMSRSRILAIPKSSTLTRSIVGSLGSRIDHDVLGLEVAVDDPERRARRRARSQTCDHDPGRARLGEPPLALEDPHELVARRRSSITMYGSPSSTP